MPKPRRTSSASRAVQGLTGESRLLAAVCRPLPTENARLYNPVAGARYRNGAFTTYVALNGTGYVRVMAPNVAETGFPVTPAEERFEYVEHILLGLASVTYYGRAIGRGPAPPPADPDSR